MQYMEPDPKKRNMGADLQKGRIWELTFKKVGNGS